MQVCGSRSLPHSDFNILAYHFQTYFLILQYDHFECEECKALRKKLSKPDQKDALAAEIKRRKAVNQAKDDLNNSREQTFLAIDPFTETMNDKIAPIMKEIRVEEYKFHDTELTMDEVKSARNRLEREIMSASPGKVDNSPLPSDSDVLRRMRRMPLLFKWKRGAITRHRCF